MASGRTNAGGVRLPVLGNPAGPAQILSGYEAINADGEVITGSIPSQGAQTITPGTSAKTIAAGRYLSGTQTIAGDTDLVPGNIRSGVNIFGVSGTVQAMETGTISVSSTNNRAMYIMWIEPDSYHSTQLANGDSMTINDVVAPSFFAIRGVSFSYSFDAELSGNLAEVYKWASSAVYYFSGGNATISITKQQP